MTNIYRETLKCKVEENPTASIQTFLEELESEREREH